MSGSPNPTIAADFLSLLYRLSHKIFISWVLQVGEKTWRGLREYPWKDMQETGHTLGSGIWCQGNSLFIPWEFGAAKTIARFWSSVSRLTKELY